MQSFRTNFIAVWVNNSVRWLPHLLLALAILLVYYPVLGHELLEGWDDQWMVMNSFTFGRGLDNIGAILTQFHHGQYSPLNQLCYTLLYVLYLGGYANQRCRVWQNDTTLKKELKELATPTDTLTNTLKPKLQP